MVLIYKSLYQNILYQNPDLKEKVAILQTVPGIGKVIATQLITMMPEIGSMNQKQVASLAGLVLHTQIKVVRRKVTEEPAEVDAKSL